MKRSIVDSLNKTEIPCDEVEELLEHNKNIIIGFLHEDGRCGIVTQKNYKSNEWGIICVTYGSALGNHWGFCGYKCFADMYRRFSPRSKFFLFYGIGELAEWLQDLYDEEIPF